MLSSATSEFTLPNQDWLSACQSLQARGEAYCIVTIIAEVGSIPRSTGSKMVVSTNEQFDTLGGGHLEFAVISHARKGLIDKGLNNELPMVDVKRFALAADLGQCCGGATQVMFEYMNISRPKVVVFGAGHVCHALVSILKALPCHLHIIDSRQEWLASLAEQGILTSQYDHPAEAIKTLAADSFILIMTHDHSQDFQITAAALERKCFPYVGLIASKSKKQRFQLRLQEQLSESELINQLTCPIGDPKIKGKLPMQVAISISVQLIELFEKQKRNSVSSELQHQIQWNQSNQLRMVLES